MESSKAASRVYHHETVYKSDKNRSLYLFNISSDSKFILHTTSSDKIDIRQIQSGRLVTSLEYAKHGTFVPNSNFVAFVDVKNDAIVFFDYVHEMRIVQVEGQFWEISFSSDGKMFSTYQDDRYTMIFKSRFEEEANSLTCVLKYEYENKYKNCATIMLFSPDDSMFVVSYDNEFVIFETESWTVLKIVGAAKYYVSDLRFSPDGKFIFVCDAENNEYNCIELKSWEWIDINSSSLKIEPILFLVKTKGNRYHQIINNPLFSTFSRYVIDMKEFFKPDQITLRDWGELDKSGENDYVDSRNLVIHSPDGRYFIVACELGWEIRRVDFERHIESDDI